MMHGKRHNRCWVGYRQPDLRIVVTAITEIPQF